MNEKAPSNVVAINEHGQLVESEAMAMVRKEKVGKKELNTKRRATAEDSMDAYISDSFVEKDGLTDDDQREIAVAEIDERMLTLAEADMDNPGTTKAYNDLRDVKQYLLNLSANESGFWMSAAEEADRLSAEGKAEVAEIARAAAELLREVSLKPYGEDDENRTRQVIQDHNDRVARNNSRRAA